MELILIQFLILSSLTILIIKLLHQKATSNLPPGPLKLPLVGNLHHFIGSGLVPHRALLYLAQKYGPLMHLQLGELSTVIVTSPDIAREVMKTYDLSFATRPVILASEILSYGCRSLTFAPYGDYWTQLKKACTAELLSKKRVKSFGSIREQVFSDAIRLIASGEGSPVNLSEMLHDMNFNMVSRAAFQMKAEEKEKLVGVIKEASEAAAGFDIADLYPSLKLLQKMSGFRTKIEKVFIEEDKILQNIIDERRLGGSSDIDDLLDVLLKYQTGGDVFEKPLTDDDIKAILLDILAAGSETSAVTAEWAMAEMLRNPTIMKTAQDEVRRVFDDKGFVEESSIDELNYLNLIIKETLRLHPAAPLLLPRKCRQTCKIGGYTIPAETKVIINAWGIGRDPKYWEESENFNPERFLDNAIDYKGNNFEYIPFGSGRRMCPGISFGLAMVELSLAKFLYHFDWSLPNLTQPSELDMNDAFGVTARRAKELWIVPIIRRPLLV